MRESKLRELFTDEVKRKPKLIYYNTTGGIYTKKGWPDMLLWYCGLGFGVELKVDYGKLSKNQELTADEFVKNDLPFFILRVKKDGLICFKRITENTGQRIPLKIIFGGNFSSSSLRDLSIRKCLNDILKEVILTSQETELLELE